MWLNILIIAVVGAIVWTVLRPRPDFRIRVGKSGAEVSGQISEFQRREILRYFNETDFSAANITIYGTWDRERRLTLRTRGGLSPGERQMIRNYLLSVL